MLGFCFGGFGWQGSQSKPQGQNALEMMGRRPNCGLCGPISIPGLGLGFLEMWGLGLVWGFGGALGGFGRVWEGLEGLEGLGVVWGFGLVFLEMLGFRVLVLWFCGFGVCSGLSGVLGGGGGGGFGGLGFKV